MLEFSLSREILFKMLRYASGIIDKKVANQHILAQVVLRARENILELIATDRDLELRCSWEGLVLPEFNVYIPFRKIYEICRVLGADTHMGFVIREHRLTLTAGASVFVVPLCMQDGLASIVSKESPICFEVERNSLLQALQATSFVIAEQEMRSFLNGLLFEFINRALTLVATDGHRLAEASVAIEGTSSLTKCIVPRKGVLELLRLLPDFSEHIKIELCDKQLVFFDQKISFTVRLLVGNFPGHLHLVNPQGVRAVRVARGVLKEALLRVTALFFESFCQLSVRVFKGQLWLMAHTEEQDFLEESIAVEYSGEEISIKYNGRYLIEVLNHISVDIVELFFAHNNSLLVVDPVRRVKYVIMPLQE